MSPGLHNAVNIRKVIITFVLLTTYVYAADIYTESPYAELGVKITKFNTSFIHWEPGYELWILENYLGVNAEGLLCFFNNLFFRFEFTELRKYEYTDEIRLVTLSNLNMNLEFQIPIRYSVKPFVFLGIKYGPFYYRSPRDTIFEIENSEFHFGFGIIYRLNKKIRIIFESQLYSDSKWYFPERMTRYWIQTWGFERLSLGLRYKFITF